MDIQKLNSPKALKEFLSAYHKRLHQELNFPRLKLQKSLDHAAMALSGLNWHQLITGYESASKEAAIPSPVSVASIVLGDPINSLKAESFPSEAAARDHFAKLHNEYAGYPLPSNYCDASIGDVVEYMNRYIFNDEHYSVNFTPNSSGDTCESSDVSTAPYVVVHYFKSDNNINPVTFKSKKEISSRVQELIAAEFSCSVNSIKQYEKFLTKIFELTPSLPFGKLFSAFHKNKECNADDFFDAVKKLSVDQQIQLYNAISHEDDWVSYYDIREPMPSFREYTWTVYDIAQELPSGTWCAFKTASGNTFVAQGRHHYLYFMLLRSTDDKVVKGYEIRKISWVTSIDTIEGLPDVASN